MIRAKDVVWCDTDSHEVDVDVNDKGSTIGGEGKRKKGWIRLREGKWTI